MEQKFAIICCFCQEKGGDGATELENMHSARMKVVQLDVCSDHQVSQAVEFVRSNLDDPEKGIRDGPQLPSLLRTD